MARSAGTNPCNILRLHIIIMQGILGRRLLGRKCGHLAALECAHYMHTFISIAPRGAILEISFPPLTFCHREDKTETRCTYLCISHLPTEICSLLYFFDPSPKEREGKKSSRRPRKFNRSPGSRAGIRAISKLWPSAKYVTDSTGDRRKFIPRISTLWQRERRKIPLC